MWMDVKYEPGTVKVVAFDDNGKAVAEQKYILRTLSNCFRRRPKTITANGEDISFVTVSVVDKMEFFALQRQIKISGYQTGTYRAAVMAMPLRLKCFIKIP
jgi:beta-galactosidase